MNSRNPGDRADYEAAINAMIDGELDEAGMAELKAAAADDRALAQAIADAWRLHKSLDGLRLERAPARLTRKLRRIPRAGKALRFDWPRRIAAGALAAAALVTFAILVTSTREPAGMGSLDADELARAQSARRDLAVAFHYLDKVGARTGARIQHVLHDEVAEPVTETFSKHLPYTEQSRKEETS